MEDYAEVRCLFCLTGHEEAIVRAVEDKGLGRAIYPRKHKRLRHGMQWEDAYAPLLPGYVFVYSPALDSAAQSTLAGIQSVIRLLRYENRDGSAILSGADRQFADWVWLHGGLIGVLKAIKLGDHVEIVDGLFKAFHGRVVQMDRRKQLARIELDILGGAKYLWLSYDCLKEPARETE